jgi:hypothetical protein
MIPVNFSITNKKSKYILKNAGFADKKISK